jgi:hypothetical protein
VSAALSIHIDETQIARLGDLIRKAGPQTGRAIMRAVNWTGDRAYTQVVRVLVKQTGAKRSVVVKRVAKKPAFPGRRIVYRIVARSTAMPLSDFNPVQRAKGVAASPWHHRRVFAHAFIGPQGHVFVRRGRGRLPLKELWGPVISNDLVRGDTKAIFERTVSERLVPRLEHELGALLLGHSPGG